MNTNEINAAHIRDYLRGYGRNNIEALRSLIAYRFWAVLAQRELDARAYHFVSVLGNEELETIARGDLSLPELAQQVAGELEGSKLAKPLAASDSPSSPL